MYGVCTAAHSPECICIGLDIHGLNAVLPIFGKLLTFLPRAKKGAGISLNWQTTAQENAVKVVKAELLETYCITELKRQLIHDKTNTVLHSLVFFLWQKQYFEI